MSKPADCQLPLPVPPGETERITLMGMRRMARHGIHDAQAAAMFFGRIGLPFRRTLVLLRAFMVDMAGASNRRIVMAPCCALRMTRDEGAMIATLALAHEAPWAAAGHLEHLTASNRIETPLTTAMAYGAAMADIGRPFARSGHIPAMRSA